MGCVLFVCNEFATELDEVAAKADNIPMLDTVQLTVRRGDLKQQSTEQSQQLHSPRLWFVLF